MVSQKNVVKMESVESALQKLLSFVQPISRAEIIPLQEGTGRILAEDIRSPIAVPPFDRSPLDGYALHSGDIACASKETPASLRVIGEACAGCGTQFHPSRGEALRIMTGAPIPAECDCVIRQEETDEGMDVVRIYGSEPHNANICFAGEDIPQGALVFAKGERLTPVHLGVLASIGVERVTVFAPVRAALLSTGDELASPGEPLSFGKIYDANRIMLSGLMRQRGVEVYELEHAPDDAETVAALLVEAARDADIIITTGGVSVGKKDIFHEVLPLMGAQRLFWKVAMKPGTPLLCGLYEGKLMICLSGNPFAAMACYEVFAKPVLAHLSGSCEPVNRRVQARLENDFPKSSKGRRMVRAVFDGKTVRPGGTNHSSGSLSTAVGCNCLIDIPAGSPALQAGDMVEAILL